MKTVQTFLIAVVLSASLLTAASANAATCPSAGCDANWLNVPGDFSQPVNNFSMFLLNGWFNVTSSFDGSGVGGSNPLNTTGNQINFTASQFDHNGPGQGTATLNASFNHVVIGSGVLLGLNTTIYIDGTAAGALIDNADSTQGHWTLNSHLFADWGNNKGIDLGIMPLSTNASFAYSACDSYSAICSSAVANHLTASGSIMDYHSGLAYMVGQGTTLDGPFPGFRVTVGLLGQDPVVATVPAPAAAWLLGSGLLGLVGVARRKAV
ncbi:MAG: hypothetical protein KJ958_13565 [Gammaproteobacteria bacterium]|nr:hypothetical protein [Gammaproteobacteria bacterium]MBU1980187.1 hypothetical protein [Gammaproteobacteria bacterium]